MMHDSALVEELSRTSLFAGLSHRHLVRVSTWMRVVEHAPGDLIVDEGADATGFHLILSGTATVLLHGWPCGVLGPGDHFGEISLIDGLPRSASVRADTVLRTASIPSWNFAPLLQEEPTFVLALLRALCRRLRRAESVRTG